MTPQREEQLISDVSATKALLEQFMTEIKPTLATREEVAAVCGTITGHIENHKDNKTLAPAWFAIITTAALSILGFFLRVPK